MENTLRNRLTEAFKKVLEEDHVNSKEMIANNMCYGQEHLEQDACPGEFAKEEITDIANLDNKGDNSNTTKFSDDEMNEMMSNVEQIMNGLVNISVKPNDENEEDSEEMKEIDDMVNRTLKDESCFTEILYKTLNESKLFESDYAGPLDFVPDTRLNTADVVKALKAKIGDGSEGIHVDLNRDAEGNKIYSVSQIDKSKLPDSLDVVNVKLKLGDNGYTVEKTASDFPVKKD